MGSRPSARTKLLSSVQSHPDRKRERVLECAGKRVSIALVHARQTAAACPCIPEGRGRALEGAWKRESRTASRRARKGSTAAPMWYTVDEIRPSLLHLRARGNSLKFFSRVACDQGLD